MLIRQRLMAGESDKQILAFLVSRYGNFILLKPPLEPQTVLLWGTPILILICGGAAILLSTRRRAPVHKPAALSAAEEERLRGACGQGRRVGQLGADACHFVMAGLDPAIHESIASVGPRGWPGQARP